MRTPPPELVTAVKTGAIDRRVRHQVLHYRGYFRAYDRDNQLVDGYRAFDGDGEQTRSGPEDIVRIEMTPRAAKEFGA